MHGPGISSILAGILVATVAVTASLFTGVSPAPARVTTTPARSTTHISGSAAPIVTPRGAAGQFSAADGLSAALVRSAAGLAVVGSRLRTLTAQARPLLADFRATRKAQVATQIDATAQNLRLSELARQAELARSALEQSAIDSYVGGGGPLGEMAVAMASLTTSALDPGTSRLSTVNNRVQLRAQRLIQAKSALASQSTTSSTATAASNRARATARTSLQAKSAHDSIVVRELRTFRALQVTEDIQVSRAAGVRAALTRSATPAARAADSQLARILNGRDYTLLMSQSTRCGVGSPVYPNGAWPAAARCPLYAAPGHTLRRSAALAFDLMSRAYQRQYGYALCVNESYRSYAAQVAIKAALPGLAATPGTSNHGLGLALDLCGGVQDFADPAHQWMKQNGPHFGWVHPAWAEPSGGLPEPWHWEFAG